MNTVVALLSALVLSFAVSALTGKFLIPALRRLKFGQTILDIGPVWHKSKQGTPTMGGFMMIAGFLAAFILTVAADHFMGGDIAAGNSPFADAEKVKLYAGIIMAAGFGATGFFDDYIKVKKHRNEGLSVLQKTLIQLLLIAAYIFTLCFSSDQFMFIPFVGSRAYGSPLLFGIFAFIVIYATVNAVNFTDGVDGLCASVTGAASLAFAVAAALRKYTGVSLAACALAGACAGFLIWNKNPAKCFMGDTGSMFLGGLLAALAFAFDCPLILIPIGIVYVAEGASDVIQILYFKITRRLARRKDPTADGKRLFKMAPLHHHFEKCGWSENKIVTVFTAVAFIGGVIGCLLVYYGQ